jgi:hypothetical protein
MNKSQCPQTLTHGWQKMKGPGITHPHPTLDFGRGEAKDDERIHTKTIIPNFTIIIIIYLHPTDPHIVS